MIKMVSKENLFKMWKGDLSMTVPDVFCQSSKFHETSVGKEKVRFKLMNLTSTARWVKSTEGVYFVDPRHIKAWFDTLTNNQKAAI